MSDPAFTVRVATPDDSRSLDWLARLTGRSRPPAGATLLAERDGVPLAAIRLTSGTVLADLCNTPLEIIGALRFTRYRIMRQGGQTGASRSLLSRPTRGVHWKFVDSFPMTVTGKTQKYRTREIASHELGLEVAA
jgi:hypothetical protein